MWLDDIVTRMFHFQRVDVIDVLIMYRRDLLCPLLNGLLVVTGVYALEVIIQLLKSDPSVSLAGQIGVNVEQRHVDFQCIAINVIDLGIR